MWNLVYLGGQITIRQPLDFDIILESVFLSLIHFHKIYLYDEVCTYYILHFDHIYNIYLIDIRFSIHSFILRLDIFSVKIKVV